MIKSITLYIIDLWLIVRFKQTFYLLKDTIQSYIQYLHKLLTQRSDIRYDKQSDLHKILNVRSGIQIVCLDKIH